MAEQTIGHFSYQPLQDASREIRLLRIANASTDDRPIRCELSTWRLEDKPQYTAISYTWGDASNLVAILLNGKRLSVRRNCRYVLEQAVLHGDTENLWIDAICINQESDDEKSKQVAMMGDIYRNADHVNVCVGPEEDDSAFLFECVQQHAQHVKDAIQRANQSGFLGSILEEVQKRGHVDATTVDHICSGQMSLLPRAVKPELLSELETRSFFKGSSLTDLKRLVSAAYAFTKRNYFSRLWIIQELLMGRKITVYCGEASFDFPDFVDFESGLANFCFETQGQVTFEQGQRYSDITSIWTLWNAKGTDLFELTDQFAQFQCFDVRDRVFGMLALVDWKGYEPIVADYSKSALSLALQAISYLCERKSYESAASSQVGLLEEDGKKWPLVSATRIAIALDLHSDNQEIQPLLQGRRSMDSAHPTSRTFTRPAHTAQRVVLSADGYCQLREKDHSSNAFTACLAHVPSRLANQKSSGAENETLPEADNVAFREILDGHGRCLAQVPATAKHGDHIVTIDSQSFNLGLVFRGPADGEGRYRIIGQTILEENTSICRGGSECVCGIDDVLHLLNDTVVELHLDPMDLLLFCCQSLVKFDEDVMESIDHQVLRLPTSAVKVDDEYSSFAYINEAGEGEQGESDDGNVSSEKLRELMAHFNKRNG